MNVYYNTWVSVHLRCGITVPCKYNYEVMNVYYIPWVTMHLGYGFYVICSNRYKTKKCVIPIGMGHVNRAKVNV